MQKTPMVCGSRLPTMLTNFKNHPTSRSEHIFSNVLIWDTQSRQTKSCQPDASQYGKTWVAAPCRQLEEQAYSGSHNNHLGVMKCRAASRHAPCLERTATNCQAAFRRFFFVGKRTCLQKCQAFVSKLRPAVWDSHMQFVFLNIFQSNLVVTSKVPSPSCPDKQALSITPRVQPPGNYCEIQSTYPYSHMIFRLYTWWLSK